MGRKEDLERNIRESYQLIREYEEILQTSSDPKERTRAERAIKEQRSLIETWQAEYRQASGQTPPEPPTKTAGSPEPPINSEAIRSEARPALEPRKPVPWLGYVMVVLLGVDLGVVAILGWRFLGRQPELLSYLQVVTGFLALALEIVLLGIVLQQKMSLDGVLRWLGTSRLWPGIISVVTIALLGVLFWPQLSQALEQTSIPTTSPQPATPQESVAQSPASITATVAIPSTSWSPCRIESFTAEPPSPQPVGGLVIFKIRGTCESGVRAIRLLINDEWYDEKGGHIAPPEEFVPTWSTKEASPGDYTITAEVATWKDDNWEFTASQMLTYTLISSTTVDDNP